MAGHQSNNKVIFIAQELAVEGDISNTVVLCDDDTCRGIASPVLGPVMRDGDGAKVNMVCRVFETRSLISAHKDGRGRVVHGPTQRVNVGFWFNANGRTETVTSEHVDRSPMTRTFRDVLENRHAVARCSRVMEHAVRKTDFGGLHGSCTEMVTEGHTTSTCRRCLNVVHP